MVTPSLTEALRETRAVFDDAGTPQTTSEVAEHLDLGRRSTYDRLDRLVEHGELQTKKVGGNGRVWWRPVDETASSDDGDKDRQQAFNRQAARLEQQRDELERQLDQIFDRISDGFYALDKDLRFLYVNEHAKETLGVDESALGKNYFDLVTVEETFGQALEESLETQESVIFENYHASLGSWFENAIYPSEDGLSVYFRDVTGRKKREDHLRKTRSRLEALFENSPDMIDVLDTEGIILDANRRFCEELGYDKEGVLGKPIWEIDRLVDADDVKTLLSDFSPNERRKFDGQYVRRDGSSFPVEVHLLQLRLEGEVRFLALSRDITDRKERERALRDAKTQLEAANAAGEVGTWEWDVAENKIRVDSWLTETFGIESETVSESIELETLISQIYEEDRDRVETKIETAVEQCGEYEAEYRVRDTSGGLRWVAARGHVACDEDGNPETFPGALTDITERKRAETTLERQRKEVTALNTVNEVVRDVTDAVIEQSTREEIEQAACEGLATSEPYEFAWIAEVDTQSMEIELRSEVGVDGYLDDVELSADPEKAVGRGPAGRAMRTGEIQVSTDVFEDPTFEPWQEDAENYGYRSCAAIPIVHEETLYGLLGVYSARQGAFTEPELAVVGQLGEIVSHAIAAADRQKALISDEVTEIEFTLSDMSDVFGIDTEIEGTISYDRAVPLGDGFFLQYGTVDEDTVETLREIVEHLPQCDDLETLDRRNGSVWFRLRVSEPPITSAVASHGGKIQRAIIENNEFYLTVHLSPSVSSRKIIDAIQESYPSTKLQTRRQITRDEDPLEPLYGAVTNELTDRQETVLEAAVFSGFFEWPREASGKDIAESIGIAPPTFSQHLRKAQGKVFKSLFPDSTRP